MLVLQEIRVPSQITLKNVVFTASQVRIVSMILQADYKKISMQNLLVAFTKRILDNELLKSKKSIKMFTINISSLMVKVKLIEKKLTMAESILNNTVDLEYWILTILL